MNDERQGRTARSDATTQTRRRTSTSALARIAAAVVAVAVLTTGPACGGSDAKPTLAADSPLANAVPSPFEPSRQANRTFVGEVASSGLWVAVVADRDYALAFFCDGERTWGLLEGDVEGGRARLEGKDARLEGRLNADAGEVRLVLGGASHEVRLSPAVDGSSGLYRVAAEDSFTWWIQRASGLKGATTEGGTTKGFQTADAQGFETNTAVGGSGGGSRRRR